eukprot:3497835-Pleurochrysis_carterae.AAC.1
MSAVQNPDLRWPEGRGRARWSRARTSKPKTSSRPRKGPFAAGACTPFGTLVTLGASGLETRGAPASCSERLALSVWMHQSNTSA